MLNIRQYIIPQTYTYHIFWLLGEPAFFDGVGVAKLSRLRLTNRLVGVSALLLPLGVTLLALVHAAALIGHATALIHHSTVQAF